MAIARGSNLRRRLESCQPCAKKGWIKMALEVVQLSDLLGKNYRMPPRVSISTCGTCRFNPAATREYLLREGKILKLYYDKMEKHIGFEVNGHKDDNTLVIRKKIIINLSKFFFLYKLDPKEYAGSYDIIPHGALFIIDLKNRKISKRVKAKE